MDFDNVLSVLGKEGTYSKIISDYEFRNEQIDLSKKITDALNEKKILLAEAGTGVGKTMAYLIPALLYSIENGPVVISTNTINLQSQLLHKDVPHLALSMNLDFQAMLVKGRNNYICRNAVDEAHSDMFFVDNPKFEKLKKWLKKTKTGEYQDLNFVFPEWYELASNSHTCKRENCPYKEAGQCFYYKMQSQIPYANLIITNHSLFFADLMAKSIDSYGGILPDYSAVIFDEAHHIEDNASKSFGAEFSSNQVPTIIKRLKNRSDINVSKDLLKDLNKQSESLFSAISKKHYGEYFLGELYNTIGKTTLDEIANKIKNDCDAICADLEKAKKSAEKDLKGQIDRNLDMVLELGQSVERIFFNEEEDFFSWGETRGKNVSLHLTPIDVASLLYENLFSLGIPLILTSATLSAGGNFDYMKNRLGIREENLSTINLGAPFDYMKNAYLYVPKDIEAPNDSEEYLEKITNIIEELIDIVKGNAFVLFTSYKMLNAVYDKLVLGKYKILKQGEMSNEELLKEFKKNEETCLFGVSSFWEGIDVKGDKLSMVIMDKIPFPVPSSPVTKSKCDFIDKNKGNSFLDYSVPCACIKLKQGFGRLIRTKTDRGVVAILDSRIHTKNYKRQILVSIPKCKGTTKIEKVRDFFEINKKSEM